MKTIVIGCDHAAYTLKSLVAAHLRERGFTVIDVGTNSPESCHYPVFAHRACEKVLNGEADLGTSSAALALA